MLDLCKLIFGTVIDLLRSRATLEAEVVVLRQQINVLRRASPNRRPFGAIDRLILGGVCRLFPKSYDALAIVRPDTVIRWHRAGFRLYWRWKSRRRCGRPIVSLAIRRLIREMSVANPLWGAPRIHGELLKLGVDAGQTSVAKYMARWRDHIVIFGVRHLRHVLLLYMGYYNGTRTHLSLNKDAPISRGVEWAGNIVCRPILGGLHHQYGRM